MDEQRYAEYRSIRKAYRVYCYIITGFVALISIVAVSGVLSAWIYWVGSWKLAIGLALAGITLLIPGGALISDIREVRSRYQTEDPEPTGMGIYAVTLAAAIGTLFLFSTPDATTKENYISEEHQLAAAANHPGTQTTGAIFASINTTTEDTTGTLHYIRIETTEDGRQAKTLHTWPMDEIKIFEDATTPVEKHHHTRSIATNPYTGEQKVMADTLDYVEISVPAGSVANNYTIDVAPGS